MSEGVARRFAGQRRHDPRVGTGTRGAEDRLALGEKRVVTGAHGLGRRKRRVGLPAEALERRDQRIERASRARFASAERGEAIGRQSGLQPCKIVLAQDQIVGKICGGFPARGPFGEQRRTACRNVVAQRRRLGEEALQVVGFAF